MAARHPHRGVMTELLDAALNYAARGWPVFPLTPGKKTPATRHGVKDSTTDLDRITAWWTRTPDAGIGIATGPTAGIWVLDIDIDTTKDGRDTLADLETQHGQLPDTLTQLTPSGGEHRVFIWPTSHDIRNSQSGRIGAGLDVRGDGGYICAEPTTLDNGRAYEFDLGCDTIADAPVWLLNLVAPTPAPTTTPPRPSVTRTDRPGDRWAAATDWADILTPDGWTLASTHGQERRWVRPGKNPRDGASATTGHSAADTLKIFTSSLAPTLMPDEHYTKLGYLAATRHSGNLADAAAALAEAGWGEERPDANALGLTTLTAPTAAPAAAAPHVWAEPKPLETPVNLPSWPTWILPDWIRDHVEQTADAIQVPIDLCAQFALGALATACMGYTTIRITDTWSEPLNLYLATIMPSGGGKSPAEKAMVNPLRDWEAERREATRIDAATSETERRILEKKVAELEKSAAMNPDAKAEARQARIALETHQTIRAFRRLANDATPERLAELLSHHKERMALLSAEAPIMDMVAGAYSKLPNIDVYLNAFSGEQVIIDRKGSAGQGPTEIILRDPLLTISVAMQPNVIGFATNNNRHAEGRGFFARFMYSAPTDMRGRRDHHRMLQSRDPETGKRYATQLRHIAEAGQWPTNELLLTPDATIRLIDANAERERWCVANHEPAINWASKLAATIPRVAALLHIAWDRPANSPVDIDICEAALALSDYWFAHFLHLNPTDQETKDLADEAQAILDKVQRRQTTTSTPREIQLAFRTRYRSVEDVVPALQFLEERGWLRLAQGEWGDIGVRGPKVIIEFHPTTCSGRATAARDRRATTRDQQKLSTEVARGRAVVAHPTRATTNPGNTSTSPDKTPRSRGSRTTPSSSPTGRVSRAPQQEVRIFEDPPTDTPEQAPNQRLTPVPTRDQRDLTTNELADLDHDIEQWF